MDGTFIWILILAGAAVALLGLFLVASERELKNKRREIAGLVAQLGAEPQTDAPANSVRTSDAASAELLARNRELENQIQMLSNELTQSRRSSETRQTTQRGVEMQDQLERVTIAYEQLSREAQELRSRLAAGESDLQSVRDDDAPIVSRLQAEVGELRRTLDSSRARIAELEEDRHDLPDLNAIAREREAERENYRTQIADMEKRLLDQRQELAAVQTLREKLAQSERDEQALRAEISRHESEIQGWQGRLAAAEASARRLTVVQGPYRELLKRHGDLADSQRGLQEELAALARHFSDPAEGADSPPLVSLSAGSYSEAAHASGNTPAGGLSAPRLSLENTAGTAKASVEEAASGPVSDPKTHRFGLFIGLLFTMATGIVAVQFLGSEWEQPAVEAVTAKTLEPLAPAPNAAAVRQQSGTPSENITAPAAISPTSVKTATRHYSQNETFTEKPDSPAPAETGASGMYKVIRPSRVYVAANELSRSLGDIEPGVNVNVVNGRDGWLEIHSKQGRPPGFLREEAVVRVPDGR